MEILLRNLDPDDLGWVSEILIEAWASTRVVSRGKMHNADQLPGIVAEINEERVGILTYNITSPDLEIVTLNVLSEREGIGTRLVERAEQIARIKNCSRIWVITTNDNTGAISFYETLGFKIAAVHYNAIEYSRRLKPEIPLTGIKGIPITDEIELEKILD
ncbi:MAG: GNAT family N-acetyltransferase [Candidatus Thorarchaeota archaeon]